MERREIDYIHQCVCHLVKNVSVIIFIFEGA